MSFLRGEEAIARACALAPRQPLARARWLFLVFALVSAALLVPELADDPNPKPWSWPLGVVAALALALLWLRAHRAGALLPGSALLEAGALLAAGVAVGRPIETLGVLLVGLSFRSLYASGAGVQAGILLYIGAFLGGLAIEHPDFLGVQAVFPVIGFVLTGNVMYALARALDRHEQACAREQAVAGAAATLVSARGREEILRAPLAAILTLAGPAKTRASLMLVEPHRIVVAAAAGRDAAALEGHELDRDALPAVLAEGRSLELGAEAIESLGRVFRSPRGARQAC